MAHTNAWDNLFGAGTKLQGKSGEVPLSHLANKTVGLYFSAHWCPPCKMFTPKLAEFYKTHHEAKNLEVVFISSDRDENQFNTYYSEMPWLTLPYAARERKAELSKKYKVQGIPTFVILDKDGNTITTKARENVMADPTGAEFPWHPKSFWDMIKGDLLKTGGQTVDAVSHLKATTAFGVYFSAHWCGPCRQFTPVLTETYKTLKAAGKHFEVVFVSGDHNQHEFDEYFGSMPWTAIPFTDKGRIEILNQHFEVEGIPHFVLLDGAGKVITKNARARVEGDRTGNEFPWHPKPLNSVDVGASELNESACLIYLNSGLSDSDLQLLEKVATDYTAKWKDLSEPRLLFLYGKDSPMTTRVKSFTNVPDNTLFVLSIPDGAKTVKEGHDFSEQSVRTFIDAYLAGSLKSKGIKE